MNTERLQNLAERYIADLLTEEEKAELTKWLDEDPEHRAQFREVIELEFHLDSHLSAPDQADENELVELPVSASWGWLRKWEHVGVAALLMICLTLGWMLWSDRGRQTEGPGTSDSFAKLTLVSGDAVFREDHELPRKSGSYLGKGWVLLDRGAVEIEFHSGAQVEVTGPAVFGIDTAMRGFLESGEVSVYAPEEARDFVIGTAQMEVVDLGTKFQLKVDQSSQAEVTVTEGLVDLHLGGEGEPRRIQSLPAGLHARIGDSGEVLSVDGDLLDPETEAEFGLLAHWSVDDISADRTVADISGNGRHGIFKGEVEGATVPGMNGDAVSLKQGNYIDISDHISELGRARTFTFSAWVKDAKNIVFSFSDGTPRNRVQFELWGNLLVYGWQRGALFDAVQGRVPSWESGRWHHVAAMVSGGKVTLYVDGNHLVSRSTGHRINSETLTPSDLVGSTQAYIGLLPSNHNHKPQRLGGMIDDIQFYGRALDEQAVRFLFENPGEVFTGHQKTER